VPKRYPSDLTDKQWRILEPLVPSARFGGRPYANERRELVNGMLYRVKEGCSWPALPKDFPPWKTVYHYFRVWTLDGSWQQLHDHLRGQVRQKAGKDEQPTALIIDSQSVKTGQKGGQKVGMRARKSKAESVILP
jgi:putative transposase